MYQGRSIGALILMAGKGTRFGSEVPKQFHLLSGKAIYLHPLELFLSCGFFDEIVLACPSDWIERIEALQAKTVAGGATRQESSRLGLAAFSAPPDIVLIHDAVRPFVTQEIIEANLQGAIEWGAVDTCIPSTDTLVHTSDGITIGSIPLREHYFRGQTPQTFRWSWIIDAHEKALEKGIVNASDDCRLLLEAGYPVRIVRGAEENFKITTAFDL